MRLFVAVELTDALRAELGRLIEDLRRPAPGLRWARPEQIHLTLKFLGEVEEARVAAISERLLGAVSAVPGGFTVHARGVGTFGGREPRVVWAGIEGPEPPLAALSEAVEEASRAEGFAPEERAFKPHLTLARVKQPSRGLREALREHQGRELGRFPVRACALFQSLLGPEGSSYVRLREFPLQGSGG